MSQVEESSRMLRRTTPLTVPHGDSDWDGLTTVASKVGLYRAEGGGYIDRGRQVAERALGSDFREILRRLAVIVVHPDGLACRKVAACVAFLRRHGFDPLFAVPFLLDAVTTSTLWKYQFNVINDSCQDILKAMYGEGPVVDDRPA